MLYVWTFFIVSAFNFITLQKRRNILLETQYFASLLDKEDR